MELTKIHQGIPPEGSLVFHLPAFVFSVHTDIRERDLTGLQTTEEAI